MLETQNECANSKSEVLVVKKASVPAAPITTVKDKACVIYVEWTVPESAWPITGYDIILKDR